MYVYIYIYIYIYIYPPTQKAKTLSEYTFFKPSRAHTILERTILRCKLCKTNSDLFCPPPPSSI